VLMFIRFRATRLAESTLMTVSSAAATAAATGGAEDADWKTRNICSDGRSRD
jgi:hypothetical protein